MTNGQESVLNGKLTDLGLGRFTKRTNEIIKRINEQALDFEEVLIMFQFIIEDKHQDLLSLSNGSYKLAPVEWIIDTDKEPDAVVLSEQKLRLKVKTHNTLGQLRFNPDYMGVYMTKKQKEGDYVTGYEYLNVLQNEKSLNASVLFWILENQKHVSKAKRKSLTNEYSQIVFFGTIYIDKSGQEYVLSMHYSDFERKFNLSALPLCMNFPLQLPAAILI